MGCRFTNREAHDIRVPGKITGARAVAALFDLHFRKRAEPRGQSFDDRGPCGRKQFGLNSRRKHRSALQQFNRGGCRNRERSVGALHGAATHVQR